MSAVTASRLSGRAYSGTRRALVACLVVALAVPFLATLGGCARERDSEATLVLMDSVLSELGGQPIDVINRTQRWRMISSMGPGLPPPGFERENLPDPESRGAALVQAHCQGCHWMPAPQMHSAAEWPLLVRRMLLRAGTLDERMGGPLTAELLGERLLEGMRWSYMPTAEDTDSLLAYLRAYAMPVAEPEEIGEGPEAALYVRICARCHEIPSPSAHTAEEWRGVVGRMEANMPRMGVDPMTEEERGRIVSFLESRAAPSR